MVQNLPLLPPEEFPLSIALRILPSAKPLQFTHSSSENFLPSPHPFPTRAPFTRSTTFARRGSLPLSSDVSSSPMISSLGKWAWRWREMRDWADKSATACQLYRRFGLSQLACDWRLVLLDDGILGYVGVLHLLGPTRQPSPWNTSRGRTMYKRVKRPK